MIILSSIRQSGAPFTLPISLECTHIGLSFLPHVLCSFAFILCGYAKDLAGLLVWLSLQAWNMPYTTLLLSFSSYFRECYYPLDQLKPLIPCAGEECN